ncbi:pyridoxamine 5'-phosphate oxidase [Luteolibacter pohnpeiensis]|uniref:Pyridoxamine 5'-phosphate oxidase n=1 Tax=Luteolibacter pohnpeiensis TaxID=454153 RepID=A0A934S677_9BACT|nr:pyridoxamine 5'-phosphate oxidase [Luteolibacter pohnpeiensis]MBK1882613.1 pyridoxamine 5'-phosphate oxidase [Luteolibacter pohnpeiensis]
MDLFQFRKEYSSRGLRRADLNPNPAQQFADWFAQATEVGFHEPNAMSLASVDESGMPFQRIVLLKSFDDQGFTFFTNYTSRKAKHLEHCPKASLLFPWITLERQVIIQGTVEKVTPAESAEYFSARPRESQIGAWVSNQSDVIPSREFLMNKLEEIRNRFGDGEVPLPEFWGGYRLMPENIEFWQGGPARLHDRFFYQKTESGWSIDRLSP